LSRQSITGFIAHKKTATSQGPVFARSCEQGTENPRVENSVITAVNMHPEGCDLIGGFFMADGFVWKGLFLSFVTSVVLKMWLLDMHLSLRTLTCCRRATPPHLFLNRNFINLIYIGKADLACMALCTCGKADEFEIRMHTVYAGHQCFKSTLGPI
jgi:hypothetical protein